MFNRQTVFPIAAVAAAFFLGPSAAQSQPSDALFTGPNILSRGTRPIGRSGGRPIGFRANLTFGTSYYGGLTRAGLETNMRPGDVSTYSGNLGFGVSGTRATPRSSTTGQYQGFVQVFGNQVTFSGLNQFGQISHQRQLSRRWSTFVAGMGSTQTTVINGIGANIFAPDLINGQALAIPQSEPFDTRFLQGVASSGFSFKKSARLTFTMSGAGAIQRRKATALVDTNAYMANGEVSYQLSRRTGIGATYSFMTFFHKRNFGEAQAHTYMGIVNRVLSPHWSIGGGLGVLRMETQRLEPVTIDPLITALTGQVGGVQAAHSIFHGLAAQGSLNGSFRSSSLSVSYNRGANGGNGLVLTSQAEIVGAQYSYSGIRRTSLSLYGVRNHFVPVLSAFGINRYTSTFLGMGVGYRLTGFLHFQSSAQIGRSHAEIRSGVVSPFARDRYAVSAGISFQPGEVPLVLW